MAEDTQAIKGSKTRSAPGLDGSPYIILKNIPPSFIKWLTNLKYASFLKVKIKDFVLFH